MAQMVQGRLRLLECDFLTDREAFPRRRMAGDLLGEHLWGPWESGVVNGGKWACAAESEGVVMVQVVLGMAWSVGVEEGEGIYNEKDLKDQDYFLGGCRRR